MNLKYLKTIIALDDLNMLRNYKSLNIGFNLYPSLDDLYKVEIWFSIQGNSKWFVYKRSSPKIWNFLYSHFNYLELHNNMNPKTINLSPKL